MNQFKTLTSNLEQCDIKTPKDSFINSLLLSIENSIFHQPTSALKLSQQASTICRHSREIKIPIVGTNGSRIRPTSTVSVVMTTHFHSTVITLHAIVWPLNKRMKIEFALWLLFLIYKLSGQMFPRDSESQREIESDFIMRQMQIVKTLQSNIQMQIEIQLSCRLILFIMLMAQSRINPSSSFVMKQRRMEMSLLISEMMEDLSSQQARESSSFIVSSIMKGYSFAETLLLSHL